MYWVYSSLLWSAIILLPPFIIYLLISKKSHTRRLLPPAPPGWPIFGHMFILGAEPHKSIAALKDSYGPVVWLKIGSTNTMAILTANAAAEFFKNHDIQFADRRIIETLRSHDYHKSSLALAPYGSYWRMLRKLCTTEMFIQKKVNETVSIRRKCVDDMLSWIEKEAKSLDNGVGIHVTRFAFLAAFNILGNLMLSRDLVDPESKMASEFFTAMMGIMEWAGKPNVSDLFGCLKWFDLQGLKKKADRDKGKALEIASTFVKERLKEKKVGDEKKKDFLDALLEYEGNGKDEPTKLSEQDINIFILEIFMAGSETTSSTIEWALTELLLHPEEMTKVKDEMNRIVGPKNKVEEIDIENLPYLHAVAKESLRLHPPVPFLVPRQAIQDVDFMGYHIPKNTQVFINTWAIGRDQEYWGDEASKFKPGRFLDSKVDYNGQHFEYLPFGAGRRICAGIPLAHRMLHFILGSLIHEFDWELENKIVDMKENVGMTARKLEPLRAIPRKPQLS